MASKPGLPPIAIINLKLILAVSNAYYAKILPLYRKSLEYRRLRRRKVKNPKDLRVKICTIQCAVVINAPPRVPLSPKFPAPQPSINPRKRPASTVSCDPVESTAEPPFKKLRALTDATVMDIRTLSLVPLLKRLQDSFCVPSLIVLRHGRWFLIRQRGPVSLDKPPSFPEDLVTIKVPPGLRIGCTSK